MTHPDAEENIKLLHEKSCTEPALNFLGIKILELKPGYSKLSIKLKPEFINAYGIIFGGITMSLADEAFGYAVNSLKLPTVAAQFNIHFLSAPDNDDELTAEAKVVKSGRRLAVAEVEVTNAKGKLIAKVSASGVPL
ncbi:MAG: PaaI family thioesterase [Dehalococcoides mccartyi]|uniref:PaaI family thioesterase n=1 Tax=Dehalococcoides mccartyi TaxID=61435 RepID=UPI0025C9A997|nr:PaaI family thioesterase [Dehalococcoides mccartyi]MDN4185574.1 PaaI family thioesterase [Dehalococcoides mccartyi]